MAGQLLVGSVITILKLVSRQVIKMVAVGRGILVPVLYRMLENGISTLPDQSFYHNVLVRLRNFSKIAQTSAL